MQCDSGSVQVSWSPTVDASQFRVEMQSQITGVISSCNSTNTQCSIAHLPCGESFNISVVALRGSCQSQPSSGLNIVSGWTQEHSLKQIDGWIDKFQYPYFPYALNDLFSLQLHVPHRGSMVLWTVSLTPRGSHGMWIRVQSLTLCWLLGTTVKIPHVPAQTPPVMCLTWVVERATPFKSLLQTLPA